jgi:hypothetical protein
MKKSRLIRRRTSAGASAKVSIQIRFWRRDIHRGGRMLREITPRAARRRTERAGWANSFPEADE